MHLRIALLAATLLPAAGNAAAELPFCKLLHHRTAHRCCDDCQIHVHLSPPAEPARYHAPADVPAAAAAPISQQLMYSQLLPSTIGYTMPMMSAMPMMMPFPVQQATMAMQFQHPQAQQPQSQQRAYSQQNAAGDGCEERVARLETGVKHLSERLDKIELILENQVVAMERLHTALQENNLLKSSQNSQK